MIRVVAFIVSLIYRGSGKFAQAHPAIIDWSALRFHNQMALARFAFVATGNFFAIHPESDFSIDRPDVIMIPFPHPIAQPLGWE